eukprot:1828949-Rhodomonas_salina.2
MESLRQSGTILYQQECRYTIDKRAVAGFAGRFQVGRFRSYFRDFFRKLLRSAGSKNAQPELTATVQVTIPGPAVLAAPRVFLTKIALDPASRRELGIERTMAEQAGASIPRVEEKALKGDESSKTAEADADQTPEGFEYACTIKELEASVHDSKRIMLNGIAAVAVFLWDRQVYAIDAQCPHQVSRFIADHFGCFVDF